MAEGPVVHRYAARLNSILGGQTVDVRFGVQRLRYLEPDLARARIRRIEAWGKQFHIHFTDGRAILVHLLMWGSWGFYRKGEPWDKPAKRVRLILRTADWQAVAFSAPVVEVLRSDDLETHPRWGNLGPDPLRDDFEADEFLCRLHRKPSGEIGPVMLDQTVVAGVGNILKSEVLFRAGVHPRRAVGSLSDSEEQAILQWTIGLCEEWLRQKGQRPDWTRVYRRSRSACPQCGTPIESFRQAGRMSYVCPACQPLGE
jgi:formamidopyrimidine-DNA glycosylase